MKKRKSLNILNHNTYLLICWRWRYNYRDRLEEKTRCFETKEGKKQMKGRREKNELKGLSVGVVL
jgi:hypothetical protein